MYTHVYIHTHTYVSCVYIYIYMYIRICTSIYVHLYIYIYLYIYMYIHLNYCLLHVRFASHKDWINGLFQTSESHLTLGLASYLEDHPNFVRAKLVINSWSCAVKTWMTYCSHFLRYGHQSTTVGFLPRESYSGISIHRVQKDNMIESATECTHE